MGWVLEKKSGFARRKAQFFIIAAVVAVLAIGRISASTTQALVIDVSSDQEVSPHDVLRDIHAGLIEILEYSDNDTIEKDLEDYEHATGKILSSLGYDLDIYYNTKTHYTGTATLVEDVNVTARLTGHGADLYVNITTNIFCLRADPDKNLCSLVNIASGGYITRTECCTEYGLCC